MKFCRTSNSIFFGIIIACGCISVFSCKSTEEATHGSSIVKVGAIVPLTGEVATYGDSLKKGFDLAAAEFKGNIEVVYEDSKASPKDGVSAMQKLLSQGIRHFLGDATSGVCLALAPVVNDNQALLMISIATSDDLSNAGPFVFRNCPPNRNQAEAAAVFIHKTLKVSDVAIVAKMNPYAANLSAQFKSNASKHSLQIVFDEQYEASTRDFTTLVTKLKAANPQVVFIPGNYEETALLLRKAKELGFTAPFIGTDGAYSSKLIELAGPAAEGFYLTMLGVDESSDFYKHFALAYSTKYGGKPDVFTAYGYEGAMILFQVINSAQAIPDQRNRLETGSWDGLLGNVRFDKDGEIVRDVQVLRVKSGQFEPAK